MKIIAFANQKGGVAKTTSTYNMAAAKAKAGYRVLMIDLDPQATLTMISGFTPGDQMGVCAVLGTKDTIYEGIYNVKETGLENLYIMPSDIELAEVEQRMMSKTAREQILFKKLSFLEDLFDYCFIDCPPTLSLLTINALTAADEVIIPAKAEYTSYRSFRALKNTIDDVIENLNPDLHFAGFIITFFEKIVKDQQDMLEEFKQDGTILGTVPKSADVNRNIFKSLPVVVAIPNSKISEKYVDISEYI